MADAKDIKTPSESTFYLAIVNSYPEDKLNYLAGADIDFKNIEKFQHSRVNANLRLRIFNRTRKSILESITTHMKPKMHKNIENVIIILAGHGSQDSKDQLFGFRTKKEDGESIFDSILLITDLNNKIKEECPNIMNLFYIIDTCRASKEIFPKNYVTPTAPNDLIIISPVNFDECAIDDKVIGGLLINSYLHFLNSIPVETLLNINARKFLVITKSAIKYYMSNSKIKKHELVPKIYMNKHVRDNFPSYFTDILNITEQAPQEIHATKLNNNNNKNEMIDLISKLIKKIKLNKAEKEKYEEANKKLDLELKNTDLKNLELRLNIKESQLVNIKLINILNEKDKKYMKILSIAKKCLDSIASPSTETNKICEEVRDLLK